MKHLFVSRKTCTSSGFAANSQNAFLRAKNKAQLLKAKRIAGEMGMKENEDFWLIRDNCHTELEPEEDGKTLTCIGFKPMDSELIDKIGKKYQLY